MTNRRNNYLRKIGGNRPKILLGLVTMLLEEKRYPEGKRVRKLIKKISKKRNMEKWQKKNFWSMYPAELLILCLE
jgi:hypothetical protein